MAFRLSPWMIRAALAITGLLVAVWLGLGWFHSNAIRSEFLIARPLLEGYPLEIMSNEAGRVVTDRTDETQREGIWGLEGVDGYAQISTIVSIEDETVERGVEMLDGDLTAGAAARIDPDAYFGDPGTAHGLGFEEPRTPSDIGPHGTWFIDGRRPTWVVFVHGRGNNRLSESLRIIPSLVEQGYPVLSITYRNDVAATPSPSGMRLWGLNEWRDVDAALALAQRKGAKDFVVIGSGFGASIVSMFLHESPGISLVKGVVYDSPVLDLEGVARKWAGEENTPAFVAWLGRRLAGVRFGLDWNALNQLDRMEQFDVPMLLMYGAEDPVVPVDQFTRFAEGLPDLVDADRFEQGGHADLWNIDSHRYERSVAAFLLEVVGPE